MQRVAASYPQLLQPQVQEPQPVQTPSPQPSGETPSHLPEKPKVMPDDKERLAAKKLLKELLEKL